MYPAAITGTHRSNQLSKQPGAKILQGKNVASPGAEEPAEDSGRQDRGGHEEKSGRDDAKFEGVHDFVKFERRKGPSGKLPVQDVTNHQEVHEREREHAPSRVFVARFSARPRRSALSLKLA